MDSAGASAAASSKLQRSAAVQQSLQRSAASSKLQRSAAPPVGPWPSNREPTVTPEVGVSKFLSKLLSNITTVSASQILSM